MITFSHSGNFDNTERFLNSVGNRNTHSILDKYGKKGVEALSKSTPKNTGKTAASWSYQIKIGKESLELSFYNDNVNGAVNIAVILQYGHGTRNGGYVKGRDYINPALKPIFDELVESLWKEVTE